MSQKVNLSVNLLNRYDDLISKSGKVLHYNTIKGYDYVDFNTDGLNKMIENNNFFTSAEYYDGVRRKDNFRSAKSVIFKIKNYKDIDDPKLFKHITSLSYMIGKYESDLYILISLPSPIHDYDIYQAFSRLLYTYFLSQFGCNQDNRNPYPFNYYVLPKDNIMYENVLSYEVMAIIHNKAMAFCNSDITFENAYSQISNYIDSLNIINNDKTSKNKDDFNINEFIQFSKSKKYIYVLFSNHVYPIDCNKLFSIAYGYTKDKGADFKLKYKDGTDDSFHSINMTEQNAAEIIKFFIPIIIRNN